LSRTGSKSRCQEHRSARGLHRVFNSSKPCGLLSVLGKLALCCKGVLSHQWWDVNGLLQKLAYRRSAFRVLYDTTLERQHLGSHSHMIGMYDNRGGRPISVVNAWDTVMQTMQVRHEKLERITDMTCPMPHNHNNEGRRTNTNIGFHMEAAQADATPAAPAEA
jgi:hypothetical protein